ncbi:MAG: cupin domain-containing protein [Campylobacterales bacterium]|nr:cupin domain-containing protein [Campylobacterales bacterium]
MQNIFDDQISLEEETEHFTTLFQNKMLHIEYIQSRLSHAGEWYDQEHDEWVLLLQGEATLEIGAQMMHLHAGSYMLIAAHQRHRVLCSSANAQWLAVHMHQPNF